VTGAPSRPPPAPSLGGKADRLIALREEGERVPPFVCIGPSEEADVAELDALTSLGGTFAVRSSAIGEDGDQQSFAGQFDTFLNVPLDEVSGRIADCRRSAEAPGVRHYIAAHGASHEPIRMGVIVQQMIHADVSGIVFTANPRGLLNETVVTVGRGTGDNVVADKVPTTTYYRNASDSLTYFETAPDAPLLEPAILDELVAAGERIRRAHGSEVDIEFAVHGGTVWILQARPITTLKAGPVVTLDNANIVESYPGLTLPLTASFVPLVYHGVFRGLALRATRDERIVDQFEDVLSQMVAASSGRLYYRIDHWYQVMQVLPLSRRYIPVWQDMMGVEDREYKDVRDRFTRRQRLSTGFNIIREFLAVPAGMRRLDADVVELREYFRTHIADAKTTEELHHLHRDIETQALRRWDITLLNDLHAFVWTGLLTAMLRRKVADPREATNAFISGIATIESMKPVRALVELATTAPVGELRGIESDAEARAYLEGAGEFPARLRDYVEAYGDRYMEELKLESPTFRSEPMLLVRAILSYCEDPGHLESVRLSLSRPHQPELPRLRNPLVGWVARKAAQGIERRESSRLNRARVYGMVREIVHRVGANLAAAGALDAAADVFWLTMDEIFDPALHDARVNVARRQAEYEDFLHVPASRRLVFAGEPFDRRVNLEFVLNATTRPDVLRGVPTSGGTARGRVRVVHDPRDILDGREGAAGQEGLGGDILVTRMTDPGWVFLLTMASGVVAERGSLLSHTSIIARELGIPAVVGVEDATTLLKDGDLVDVDGDRGEVRVVRDA
jgi:phosphohistidine swiveling domain-containing protein